MRAGLVDAWPNLSHHYGIHPWDVDRLSYAEINAYVEALNVLGRAQAKAKREMDKARRR